MNLVQFWTILCARKGLFASALGSILLIALLVVIFMPRTYLGEVSLVIDTKAPDPITGNAAAQEVWAEVLATQSDIIESHNVALKVIDKLDLTKDPKWIQEFKDATDGEGSFRDWLADKLSEKVTIRPSANSNVINIDFPARDPETAARLTNAFGDAYVLTSLELKADPEKRQSNWFDLQMSELRKRVDAAQKSLADAERETSIVGTADHIDIDNAKLTEISTQLVTAQQALYQSRTRLSQMNQALVKNQIDQLPDILANPLLQTLKTDLARAEGAFAEISARFDHNHPQYISAAANVKSLQDKLAIEVERVRGSIEQSTQISQHQVDELQRALDQQKQTLINDQRKHDSLEVLNRELDSAQKAYDAGLQRTNQVRLESQIDQSTVAILNPAFPPFVPARPRPLLYMAIAFVFGTILAAGICVIVDMGDRRVRTRADITDIAGLLVLAEIPRLAGKVKLA